MYLFWWSKPFAASTRIAIRTTELVTAQVMEAREKDMIREGPCSFKYKV